MNHTIYLNYTVAQTLYAYPQSQSLTDWATYRVAMTEGTGDDTGRYTATVDDANGDIWLIFLGATQPVDWTEAISEPIDVGVARTGADGDTLETLSDQLDLAGTLAKQNAMIASLAATAPLPLNSPRSAGSIIETIRGDDHTTNSPHGAYVWDAPLSVWGDLTDATITFTSRKLSDDTVEIDGYTDGFTVLNANTESQQVQLDLPKAQTDLLTPGPDGKQFTNKFDVEVVRSDGVEFTLARGKAPYGGHTIYEDQTRA